MGTMLALGPPPFHTPADLASTAAVVLASTPLRTYPHRPDSRLFSRTARLMAHSLSANKRIRQSEATQARNRWRKTKLRESIKVFLDKVAHGTVEEATTAFRSASQVIDRTAQKGIIHKNQAARRKSRLNARLKAMATAGPAKTTTKKKVVKKA